MSIRQQMQSVLRGEGSDRLPFAPRLDLWYAARRWTDSLPAPYRGASLEEICRREGWGIYRLTPDFRDLYHRKSDWPWTALGIFRAAETLYEISLTDQVEMTVRDEGRRMHVTFDTAKGPLTAELELTDEMVRHGITFPHTAKKIATSADDFEKLKALFENLVLTPYPAGYEQSVSEIGEDGLVASWAVEIASPMNLVQRYLFDTVDFFYLYMDEYPALVSLCESVAHYYDQVITIYAQSDVEFVAWGANYDDTITYPPFFEKEISPWLKKAADAFHATGKIMISHTDGENRRLMDLIKDSGIDCAESICPHPQTRLHFHEYYAAWADKLVLAGGIPTDFFIPESATTEELVRYLEYVQEVVTPGGGYIPGITDAFSPLGDFDRLRIARDFFLR
ncbi:MAG: hypothetical protein PVJ85_04780 [Anaerolineae bacterium]|jgi:hypothetical protein